MSVLIRSAVPDDAAALAEIYRPYVLHTAITYEQEPPDTAEFRRRIAEVQRRFPFLVAEEDSVLLGYCYAHPFHTRASYQWDAEGSIYLRPEGQGRGLGRRLYEALEERLRRQGVVSLCALIADPETEDEHLTHNSLRFHSHMGFTQLGRYPRCGYKFGRWYSMVWMAKDLCPRTTPQPPLLPPEP